MAEKGLARPVERMQHESLRRCRRLNEVRFTAQHKGKGQGRCSRGLLNFQGHSSLLSAPTRKLTAKLNRLTPSIFLPPNLQSLIACLSTQSYNTENGKSRFVLKTNLIDSTFITHHQLFSSPSFFLNESKFVILDKYKQNLNVQKLGKIHCCGEKR